MSQGCGDELFGQKRAQRLVGVLRRREHRRDRPGDPAPDLQQLGPRRFRRKDERQVEVVVVKDGIGVEDLHNGRSFLIVFLASSPQAKRGQAD